MGMVIHDPEESEGTCDCQKGMSVKWSISSGGAGFSNSKGEKNNRGWGGTRGEGEGVSLGSKEEQVEVVSMVPQM